MPAIGEGPRLSADPATAGSREDELATAFELIAEDQVRKQPVGRRVEQLDPARPVFHDHCLVDIIKQPGQPRYQQLDDRTPVRCHGISSQIRPRGSEGSPLPVAQESNAGSKTRDQSWRTLRALSIDV